MYKIVDDKILYVLIKFLVTTFVFQTVAEMEGITHGIRPGNPRKVKIQAPKTEEKNYSNKTLRIQAKYGIGSAAKKKDEKKSKI